MNRPELESGQRLYLKTPVDDVEEMRAESEMRAKLPKGCDGFYAAHYQQMGGRPGTFVGFVCRGCNNWAECGHDAGCKIGALEAKVSSCSWCPNPKKPSPEHHPNGQPAHVGQTGEEPRKVEAAKPEEATDIISRIRQERGRMSTNEVKIERSLRFRSSSRFVPDEEKCSLDGVEVPDEYGSGLPARVAFVALAELAAVWNDDPAPEGSMEGDIAKVCASLNGWLSAWRVAQADKRDEKAKNPHRPEATERVLGFARKVTIGQPLALDEAAELAAYVLARHETEIAPEEADAARAATRAALRKADLVGEDLDDEIVVPRDARVFGGEGGFYFVEAPVTVKVKVKGQSDKDDEEERCQLCGRPYSAHSTALKLKSKNDPHETWYTDDSGERCPGEKDQYFCTSEAREAHEQAMKDEAKSKR